jgi:hypothetical protein
MTGSSRKGEKMCMMNQEGAARNEKDRCKCGHSTNLDALRSNVRRETYSRRTEYANLLRGRNLNSGLTRGFSNMAMPLLMIC